MFGLKCKVIIFIFSVLILFINVEGQVNDTDSSTVGVTLTSKTMIDITPDSLSWIGVHPGGVGDNNSEVNNYYAVQIQNIGSKNITHVWFNATYPTATPFAIGSTSKTNSGNYVVLAKGNSSNDFYFVNRVEYAEVNTLVYLRDPDGNMPPNSSAFFYGRFRNASNEYFWMVDKKDGNCSDNTFYIGDDPHTVLSTGSVDFENCVSGLDNAPGDGINACRYGTLIRNGEYGYANVNIGGQLYCVAVSQYCNKTFFSHWNRDYPFNECDGSYSTFAWNTTNGTDGDGYLVPGESFFMKIKVFVPYGIYEGASNIGKLVVLANSV